MGHKYHNHKEKAIDEECSLLSEENKLLKKCLHLLRENSALEISTLLSAIIAFCNGKFRKKFAADFTAVIEEHQQKPEKEAAEPRAEQAVHGVCCCSCMHPAEHPDEQMHTGSRRNSPHNWEIPERDIHLPEGEKSTQTYFSKKPRWPRLNQAIQYDTGGQTAHIRSHLNTKTPIVNDLEFDPYYLKCLVLATYYKALANINKSKEMDPSIYYPPFRRNSVGQIMQRLFMFPPRALLGSRLSRGWRPRSAGRKQSQSSRKRSVSRRCRRKKYSLVDDDLHVSSCLRKKTPPSRTCPAMGLQVGQHIGFNPLNCVCAFCGNILRTCESNQRPYSEKGSSVICSEAEMTRFDLRKEIDPILERVVKNVELINSAHQPPPDVTSLSMSHHRTELTHFADEDNKAPDIIETNDDLTAEYTAMSLAENADIQEVSKETSEEVAAETEMTSISNNNPKDFSSSSCGRTDSRETTQGYTAIDPLYTQGKRNFRSAEFEVSRPYRSGNPLKLSPVLHRDNRSDHWFLRGSENSQRTESASPPTRRDSNARPPYGNGKRPEESKPRGRMKTPKTSKDTPREGKDTPREGKDTPRGGKDMSKGDKEALRGGREEKSRELRYFSGSVNERFEPQAFSSPFVGTLDQQTAFVDTNYDNEGDRNSSSNTPTLDPEVPEKEVSCESRTCLKSPHIFTATSEPGSAGFIICRTEYLQSGPKSEDVLEKKSSAAVPDTDFPDRNYVSAVLPVSTRSRHVEDGQGLKSLLPAVYAAVCRSQDDSQLSLYEEKEEVRADSDVTSSICSSRVSSTPQDQTFGRSSDLNLVKPRSVTPMGVVKQAWTASSSSNLTVASASAVQLIPSALRTSGKNIVGEIAFQLERRILDYVFANNLPAVELESSGMARKRRFYGYTVNNIGEMINREALAGDYYSKGTERMLRERLRTLLDILTPLGYDLTDHARFSQDIINKYGLLSHIPITKPGDPETEVGINGVEVEHLQNAIVCMADTETERNNLLLLLDCLRMLAIEDGRPLFVW